MKPCSGICYICPTPIGNLKDITLRTLETLNLVDLIACEDTRRTLKLLESYEIKKKLLVFNEHTKHKVQAYLLEQLELGKNIAIVSDAGMPGIADTGQELIQACIERLIPVEVLPGPVALINALVVSGFPCQQFLFINFLPRKPGKLKKLLERTRTYGNTVCAYEAPHRLIGTLDQLRAYGTELEVCVCREMTKLHEENIRGNIETVYNYFIHQEIKGEITLVLHWLESGGNKHE